MSGIITMNPLFTNVGFDWAVQYSTWDDNDVRTCFLSTRKEAADYIRRLQSFTDVFQILVAEYDSGKGATYVHSNGEWMEPVPFVWR